MADLPRLPGIPSVTPVSDPTVASILRPMKESIEILGNAISGTPFSNTQVVTGGFGAGFSGGIADTATYDPTTDYTPPPIPTNFAVTAAFTNVLLTWNKPTYINHAHTEIWRSSTTALSAASLVGFCPGSVFADPVGTAKTYYYWIRHVSQANVYGPYNSSTGTIGSTGLVNNVDLSDAIITSGKLADAAVTSGKLNDAAVTTAKLADSSIVGVKLAALAVDAAKLADSAVTATKIANLAVGTAAIADAAISSAKIANLAVGNAAIANAAITNAKIADLAVDNAKIASLDAAKITAGYLDAARIQAGTLDAKIANLDAAVITSGFINAARINDASIANANIGAAQITSGTIDAARISSASIANANIGAAQITSGTIAAARITSASIADAVVSGSFTFSIDANNYLKIDGPNQRIDVYSGGVLRVRLGKL